MKRFTINAGIALGLGLGLTLALLWLLAMPLPARANPDTLYVATDGNDANDCSTVANRCRTVQRAVDLANTGDEIWIAGGLYTDPDTSSLGYVVTLNKTVVLRGGWDSSFTIQDFASFPTTLDAERTGRVIYISGSITPTIEGLIITRGNASDQGGLGGGIYNNGASLVVRHSVITDNMASTIGTGYGGGLYLDGSTATLADTQVARNVASTADRGYGGGLYLDGSTATLAGAQVVNNTASTAGTGYGGGLYLRDLSMVNLSNATNVEGNTASTARYNFGSGGGFYLFDSTANLTDTHVVSNTASTASPSNGRGGGFYLSDSTANLSGATFVADNTASMAASSPGSGGGFHLSDSTANLSGATVVRGNIASMASYSFGSGGGFYLSDSTATLNNTQVVSNTASMGDHGSGGGLYLFDSTANLNNTQVTNNIASMATSRTGYGGGLTLNSSTANLSGAQVVNNTASTVGTGYGGGLYANSGSTIAVNSVLARNTREGLYLDGGNHTFINDTLSDNTPNGAQVNGGTLVLTNTIVARHDVGIYQTAGTVIAGYNLFSNTTDIVGSVTNNNPVYSDPRFVDAASGDYHLQASSPAINQGDPAGTTDTGGPAPTTDFDGERRPVGMWVDIGADEFPAGLSVIKWADPDPVANGTPLTYTLRVTNTGNVTLTATVTDILPAHVTPGGTRTWTPSIPAPDGVWTEQVVVTVETGYTGPLINVVHVTTEEGATGVYTHTMNAVPTVDFASATYSTDEGVGTATITVTLDATSDLTVTVDYATSDGTATAGEDYTAVSGKLTFAPGVVTQFFDIPITDDGLYEEDETITLTLSNISNATIGETNPATLIITENEAPPTVAFSSGNYNVDETTDPAVITVTLSGATALTATVDYTTSDGTATAGEDYITVSGTLTFAVGTTALTFTVPITDDTLYENDETVNLTLSDPDNAAIGGANPATLTIINDEAPPELAFSSEAYSVGESTGAAVITATLSGTTTLTATVNYATSDGTATGEDYTAANGTLNFAPGTTALTFTVPITDDTLYENDETVNLTLSDPISATLGISSATLTITDNDNPPTVAFSSETYSADEGGGTAAVTVTLDATSGLTVTVDYVTSDGTATSGDDYTAVSNTLTFTPGVTAQTFTVPITDDNLYENDETVNLTLSNPISATLGTSSATLTITDNEAPPEVAFSSATYSVEEGAGSAVITVTLDAISGLTVHVDYATNDGTATAGDDYTAASDTLTFAPGVTTQTFTIFINDDNLYENDETISLTLSDPISATLGTSSATLIITNNDSLPEVAFSSASYSVGEGAGSALITVNLNGATALTATVDYVTSDDTATAGDDYTTASDTLTFAPGVVTQTFAVPILDDTLDEDDEMVTLTLSDASDATIGGDNPATLTIVDNDGEPTVRFSTANYTVGEAEGSKTITVTLSNTYSETVTVDYTTSDGTATAGEDYTAISNTLTFTPGVTSQSFTVSIMNDRLLSEPDETIMLTLSNASNATIRGVNPATLTIINDPIGLNFDLHLPLILKGGSMSR